MRVIPTKTREQRSRLVFHRTRRLFIRQHIAIVNSIRWQPAEFGIVAPRKRGIETLLQVPADSKDANRNGTRVHRSSCRPVAAAEITDLELKR